MPEVCNHNLYKWVKEDNGDGRWKWIKVCANPKCQQVLETVYKEKKEKDQD